MSFERKHGKLDAAWTREVGGGHVMVHLTLYMPTTEEFHN